MATHSSVLAWRIPGMGEPGGLLSMGLQRVGHDWRDLAAAAASFGEKRAMGAREGDRKKVEWSECITKSKNKFVSVKCTCEQGLRYKVCKCIFAVKWKVKVKVTQPCLTLCDPTDYPVHEILQARILEWVAFPFSGDLPNQGIKPRSPTLQADSLPVELQGKSFFLFCSRSWSKVLKKYGRVFLNKTIDRM